ncbi:hypothetical protein LXA43DRAFT_1068339 [Ganoderma leucocontextum]|nr:hypothetical protein LXA43DRAFT_1068339 [Ganoderma leucocontextum]
MADLSLPFSLPDTQPYVSSWVLEDDHATAFQSHGSSDAVNNDLEQMSTQSHVPEPTSLEQPNTPGEFPPVRDSIRTPRPIDVKALPINPPWIQGGRRVRFDRVLGQLVYNQEVSNRRQEHTEAQLTYLVDEGRSSSRSLDRGGSDHSPRGKDSTGNYARRCIRKHVAFTFGFSPTGAVLAPPSEEFRNHVLSHVNRGGIIQRPFVYDWKSPPSSLYNLCIEGAFCADFWASVESGLYDLDQIPPAYQERRRFIETLRTYLAHVKRMLHLASQRRTRQVAFKNRSAKNSRKSTTYHNRRNAISFMRDQRLAARIHALVSAASIDGISSDEEGEPSRGRVREYLVFDKAWRSKHLVEIYRWLDGKHAEMRNPHGAPIRTRFLRPGHTRENATVPKGLPVDCYDPAYLRSLSGYSLYAHNDKQAVAITIFAILHTAHPAGPHFQCKGPAGQVRMKDTGDDSPTYIGYPGGPPMTDPYPVYPGTAHLPMFPRIAPTDGAFLDAHPGRLSQYAPLPTFRPPSSLVQSPPGGVFEDHRAQWQATEPRRVIPQDGVWRTRSLQYGLDPRHLPYRQEYYDAHNPPSDLRTTTRSQHMSDIYGNLSRTDPVNMSHPRYPEVMAMGVLPRMQYTTARSGTFAASNVSAGEGEILQSEDRVFGGVRQSRAPVEPGPVAPIGDGRQNKIQESILTNRPSAQGTGTRNSGNAGASGAVSQAKGKMKDVSSQSFSTFDVYPYMFPAYGLARLADNLIVGVKVPEWTQVVRAAIILTARVEDLRHIQGGRRPPQDFVLLVNTGDRETWVSEWVKKQPTQRRRPVIPSQVMRPQDCLQYPQDTSASDWPSFWPSTRKTVFTVLSGLKVCSPYGTIEEAGVVAMDPCRWSLWIQDVLWTLRQLIRIVPSESGTIMALVRRAEEFQNPKTAAIPASHAPQPREDANQSVAGPSSTAPTASVQNPSTSDHRSPKFINESVTADLSIRQTSPYSGRMIAVFDPGSRAPLSMFHAALLKIMSRLEDITLRTCLEGTHEVEVEEPLIDIDVYTGLEFVSVCYVYQI